MLGEVSFLLEFVQVLLGELEGEEVFLEDGHDVLVALGDPLFVVRGCHR